MVYPRALPLHIWFAPERFHTARLDPATKSTLYV